PDRVPHRPDRVHRRRARGHRQLAGRRRRRHADRVARRLLRRASVALAREPVDRGRHLHDPDPDPRAPSRRPARRAHAGRSMRARDVWWQTLARLGLTEERWRSLPGWKRRAAKAGVVGLLGMIVLAPIYGFDGAAYLAFG